MKSNIEKLYEVTNSGLDIIKFYFPNAKENGHFKIREEKTPSVSLKISKGVWLLIDFGDDAKPKSPIDICMEIENCDFKSALNILLNRYGVQIEYINSLQKPDFEKRQALENEKDGDFSYDKNQNFSEYELKLFGKYVTEDVCIKYSYYSVANYKITKNGQTTIVKSNEKYPIFIHECDSFRKIYQPLCQDKSYKFFYNGEKPKDYVNGLEVLNLAFKELNATDADAEASEEGQSDSNKKEKRLPEVILCSGERDALNVAGLGYIPIWLNSETAEFKSSDYLQIMKMVFKIYNLPDIDDTGIEQGRQLALKYNEIYTIELPKWLRLKKDHRGNTCKDFRDFIDFSSNPKSFSDLLKVAKRSKFWAHIKMKDNLKLEINTVFLLYFLELNGFYKIVDPDTGKITHVRVEKNKVKKIVNAKQIREFILKQLVERKIGIDVRNLVLNSRRTGVSVMDDLIERSFDFKDFTHNSQMLYFMNVDFELNSNSDIPLPNSFSRNYVWDEDVIKYNWKRLEPSFTANYIPGDKRFEFKIQHTKSHYFRFLINASRIYWREELEEYASLDESENLIYKEKNKFSIDGSRLDWDMQNEQEKHLLNKIFCIGYLLHRYKAASKAWIVWVMENRVTSDLESSGGSGKSLMISFLQNMVNTVRMDGRNKKLTENSHFTERVSRETDLIFIDDAYRYFDFDSFYNCITGDMAINPKNEKSWSIPYEKSPKIVVTSNYPTPDINSSAQRRTLLTVFSDYYHKMTEDNGYLETRTVADDFGYDLFRENYDAAFWNEDYNFCVDCLLFYLHTLKHNVRCDPPMENVNKRINRAIMGEAFLDWASIYFASDGTNVNCFVDKNEAIVDCRSVANLKNLTAHKFTKALNAFCKNTDYVEKLNPSELCDRSGRIIKRVDGKIEEKIYIKTIGFELIDKETA